jgi:ABC-type amino acid transport substrate-binding protein
MRLAARRASFYLCLVSGAMVASQNLTILCEDYPPAQYITPEGQLTGFAIEVVREIQARVGNADPIKLVP